MVAQGVTIETTIGGAIVDIDYNTRPNSTNDNANNKTVQ